MPTTSLRAQNWFSTTLSSSISASDTTIPLNSVPTNSEGYLVIEPSNSSSREIVYYTGKTASAVTLTDVTGRGVDGTTAASHPSGSSVKLNFVNAYWDALRSLFTTTPQSWTSASCNVSSVAYNGNRSYTLTVDADQTSVISNGMRLRTSRTVAAPTQCTSLNGTNQYYSKSSPSGMTFTDDFVVGAWVKLSSYPSADAHIISRYNGTSGFRVFVASNGTVQLYGLNGGSGNYNGVVSYQSVPLNKWVHVTAQLDMSTAGTSATTSYIMFDGVEIPAAKFTGGTNPTALIQAGNLEIGSQNGGTGLFPGKIAQAFVSSAKITQANIKTLYSQGLTSSLISTHSIISAYSFDNSINDLNTTNANNLTASGSAVATNADSPFTQNGAGTPGGTYDYGIVTGISASTITVQVPEGCTIPTSGGVASASYSTHKAPYGFPNQRGRYDLLAIYKTQVTQSSPTQNVWYNPNTQIYNPVGEWDTEYQAGRLIAAGTSNVGAKSTLSTTNNTESDTTTTCYVFDSGNNSQAPAYKSVSLSVASAAVYYVNVATDATSITTIGFGGDAGPLVIRSRNSYL